MELHEALGRDLGDPAQMARTQTFGGFRSLTVASSGFLGILAAIYQANRIPRPMEQIEDYVALWSAVAALSLLAVGVELVYSYSAAMSTLRRRLTTHAIRQFVPCLVAGARLTAVIIAPCGPRPPGCCPDCGLCFSDSACLRRPGCCRDRLSGSAPIS